MQDKIKNIEELKLMLPDYIMDRVSADEKIMIEDALKQSTELRELLKELSGTFSFVSDVKFKEPPDGYWQTLLSRIHEKIEEKQNRSGLAETLSSYWKALVPIAAVILIALVYFLVINKPSDSVITKKPEEIKKEDSVKKPVEKKEIVKDNKEPVQEQEVIKRKSPSLNRQQFTKENTTKAIDKAQKTEEQKSENGDYASENIEDESIFGEAAGTLDEETESDLNKLNNKEQESLIKDLKNSNF